MTKIMSILAILLMGVGSEPTVFCSCLPKSPVNEAFKGSDLVALGEVLSVEIREESDHWGRKNVQFRVEKAFKGTKTSDTLNILTGMGAVDCGVHFAEGGKYIVYAFADEKIFRTNICTRTTICDDKELLELEKVIGED